MLRLKLEELRGTTTVGIICDGGVILAAERRALIGNFIASKTAKKIYKVNERMALTTAGAVGDAQMLARIIAVESRLYEMRRGVPMSVRSAVTLLSNILSTHRIFPYYVQLLVGGVDSEGPHLFSIDPIGGTLDEKEIVATGSGSPIAYGVLEQRYSPTMSLDDGLELAIEATYAAMKRDSASGDSIEAVRIKQFYEVIEPEKAAEILRKLEQRRMR